MTGGVGFGAAKADGGHTGRTFFSKTGRGSCSHDVAAAHGDADLRRRRGPLVTVAAAVTATAATAASTSSPRPIAANTPAGSSLNLQVFVPMAQVALLHGGGGSVTGVAGHAGGFEAFGFAAKPPCSGRCRVQLQSVNIPKQLPLRFAQQGRIVRPALRRGLQRLKRLFTKQGQIDSEGTPMAALLGKGPTVGRLFELLRPDLHWLGVAFVFLSSAAIAQALIPHFLSATLRAIIDGQSAGTLNYASFGWPLMRLVSAGTLGAIFASLRGACFIIIGSRASVRLRSRLFRSLLMQEAGFFDVTKTGEITSRLTQDCQRAADQVTFNVNIMSRTLVQLIATLCFMLYYSWELTAFSFVTVPLIVLVSKKFGTYMRKLSEATQQKLADANSVAEEAIGNLATVRTFAGEPAEARRFAGQLDDYVQLERSRAKTYVAYLSTTQLLPQLGNCFVFFQIGRLCMNGFPAPALLACVFYLQTLNDCFSTLADFYTNIVQALGSATRVFELLDRQPEAGGLPANSVGDTDAWAPQQLAQHAVPSSTLDAGKVAGKMELREVHFNYPARPDRPVLRGLTLDCPPGQVVALVGPSGGGKSTCVALLKRLYAPADGSVLLDGQDVWSFEHDGFHEIVSIVGQEPVLFGRSVRDNILYGLPADHPARERPAPAEHGEGGEPGEAVLHAAKLANAHDFISALPGGYDSQVGERGVQLSGGQKQRISIARALVRKPKVLLLDEATSALDVESERLVQDAIGNLIAQHDMTVVVVAHRLSTVKAADKICVVEDGVVVEQGTHDSLMMKSMGRYKRLVQRQLQ